MVLQAATRYCLVHVDTPPDTCRQWNQQRDAAGAYSEAIFEDLACRWGHAGLGMAVLLVSTGGCSAECERTSCSAPASAPHLLSEERLLSAAVPAMLQV